MHESLLISLAVDWWSDLRNPRILEQLGLALLAVAIAWTVTRWLRPRLRERAQRYLRDHPDEQTALRLRSVAGLEEILFPLFGWLILLLLIQLRDAWGEPTRLLQVAAALLFSWTVIRTVFYIVRRAFLPSGLLAAFERGFAALVWLAVALHLTGLLPGIVGMLESVTLPLGKHAVSLWQILNALFWIAVTLVAALWGGALLEARLLGVASLDRSFRVVLARFFRAVLIVVALLVSLGLVGIDLTVLSVFGGALGVGLGLGLQRIASNYVSGFIILLERSLRPGDLITADKYLGVVSEIRTRYTVLRALDGAEAIIPNELLVAQPVLNNSYTDKKMRFKAQVQISYASDPELAMRLMVEAAQSQPRVLADPGPKAFLASFGSDGIDLELGFWLPDPEEGSLAVRSDINLRIWRSFKENGIEIPFPQRDVRVWLSGNAENSVQGIPGTPGNRR